MNLVVVSIVAGVLFFIGIWLGGQALLRRVANLRERVRQQASDQQQAPERDRMQFMESVVKPLGTWVPRSAEEMSKVEQKLTQAGIRRKDGPLLFYGSQIAIALSVLFVLVAAGL